ncbi:MAG: DNA polymerase domain-containing protein [Methanobacteriota archaeon]
MTPARGDVLETDVGGRRIRLTNLDKVFFPSTGFRKGDVIRYYARIAPVLLPHLAGRPLTLKRYPEGVDGPFFYQKECPPHRPDFVRVEAVPRTEGGEEIRYCVVDDLASLVWLANMADLELHACLWTAGAPDRPTTLAFDLDPGPPAGIREAAAVALLVRDALRADGLEAYPKTSGGKGIQVYAP